mmetsp:Transcript_31097/g.88209  ORF Transcript_31097/g.88209 Transcript_31097/m.88209 type:complete len:105 (-) Transcript_31097:161-475(-)
MGELLESYRGMIQEAEQLVAYFGEQPTQCGFEKVCGVLLEFVEALLRSDARGLWPPPSSQRPPPPQRAGKRAAGDLLGGATGSIPPPATSSPARGRQSHQQVVS